MSLSNQERNADNRSLRDHPIVVLIGALSGLAVVFGLILEVIRFI